MSKQYGFYMDTERCIKCWACEVACKQWNGIPAGTIARRKVYEVETGTFPNVSRTFISTSCMHCDQPACAAVCPAGAISKRPDDGIVVVDKSKCIGCHYCFFACPFSVPQYTDEGMDKCDMCLGNGVKPGEMPHCVATCPTEALQFGELSELRERNAQAIAAGIAAAGDPSTIVAAGSAASASTDTKPAQSVSAETVKPADTAATDSKTESKAEESSGSCG